MGAWVPFFLFLFMYLYFGVCVYKHGYVCPKHVQRSENSLDGQFSTSTMWRENLQGD